ncbi:MAG: hypothetical protein KF845_14440 [Cyclobacteriaceae bacterium]|nr:hypothetical protein [Cyclobacteriaceae bacterium]
MLKRIVIVLLCLSSYAAVAQREIYDDGNYSFKERAYVGLGLSGLNFGRDNYYGRFFSIGGSGQLGYMVTKNFSSGVGLEYNYTTYSDIGAKDHVYGWYPFLRHNFLQKFFVQADYDMVTIKVTVPGYNEKYSYERFFAGLGYYGPAGNRAFMNVLVSYDFLYTNSSPFASPFSIRFYFTTGFSN